MRIILIDNYDSFTYNLLHSIEEVSDAEVVVKRNDQLSIDEVNEFDAIVLSPGPGIPSEAGLLLPIIKEYAGIKPILGVCLGHQAIAEALGGSLINLSEVFHGVESEIKIVAKSMIFENMDSVQQVGRYHSWVVDNSTLPTCLEVTAISDEGQIMGIQHNELPIYGIQFHPESVLTPCGNEMISNFIKSVEATL